MLNLKLQYFGHLMQRTNSLEKDPNAGKVEGRLRGLWWNWTWFWASSTSWWRTGRPSELQSMGFQRVRYNWATELIQQKWYSDQFWLEENSVVEIFAWYPPSHLHHWCPFEVSDYWHWIFVDTYLWPSKQSEEPDALCLDGHRYVSTKIQCQ